MNFGLVMIGFGVSALIFQPITQFALPKINKDLSYTLSYIIAAVTCAVAILLVLLLKSPAKFAEQQEAKSAAAANQEVNTQEVKTETTTEVKK